jgi:hypothetical protein
MPSPCIVPVNLGFDVADGEDVRISFQRQSLKVTFTDWQEKKVSFLCSDTVAFRWQEVTLSVDPAERDDAIYEISDSVWIEQHRNQGCLWATQSFHHYKLNFNAAGTLEVICTKVERAAD